MKNLRLFLPLCFLLTACAAPTPVVTHLTLYPTATRTTLPATPTRTLRPTLRPTATLIPTEVPAPPAPIACPPITNSERFSVSEKWSLAEFKQNALDFLNQGGPPENLAFALPFEVVDAEDRTLPWQTGSIFTADLNQDMQAEVFWTLASFYRGSVGEVVFIFICGTGNYDLEVLGFSDVASIRLRPINLIGDDNLELVVEGEGSLLMAGCFYDFAIFQWQAGHLFPLELVFTDEPALGCATTLRLSDFDNDGNQEITLVSNTNTTFSAGLGRDITVTLTFTQNTYQVSATVLGPPIFRFQVLGDAQQAFDIDNLELAIRLYEQAAHDATLEDSQVLYWGTDEEPFVDHPREYQSAFALFRLTALWLKLGDADQAASVLQELATTYPTATPGGEFAALAQVLQSEFAAGHTPVQACVSVTAQIQTQYPELERHIGYWGWANISYTNATLCPFR